ncbi:Adenosine deaminase-like protein [Symbiodinium microadriaticum]|uniref:Adenosine deaminase-like protein n=1 Tax=Symbiodinium microadriaticum TaxID=2951 RepID=A0A1Q9E3C3_SYMMI|nr:Adenosine deaminase-like protein [Symbiodinium microadriaticum]
MCVVQSILVGSLTLMAKQQPDVASQHRGSLWAMDMAPQSDLEPLTLEEIRSLPKLELHAHLSGSITQQKLIEMLERRGDGAAFTPFNCKADRSNALAKCFDYFAKVASVITDLDALKESTLHVLDHFAAERCIYLELRTSPKQFKVSSQNGFDGDAKLTSKLQYLETVRDAIQEFHSKALQRFGFIMEVRILLSVDRGKVTSKESALAQIDDILEMQKVHPDLVVGIDVCGNPHANTVKPYLLPALLERSYAFQKLPITFHTAEIPDDEESELIIDSMLKLNIRRLGHVTYLPDKCRRRVLHGIFADGGVGIEICPTSNMITKEIPSLDDHHFMDWWQKSDKILLSVNTDDVGLFSCDLSSEIYDLATAFRLSRQDVISIQRQAIRSAFHPDTARLSKMFDDMLSSPPKLLSNGVCLEVNGHKRQKLNGLGA